MHSDVWEITKKIREKMTALERYKKLLKTTIIRADVPLKESEEFKTFLNLLTEIRPKKLFRYRICSENNFDALIDDKVYFNSPTKFNDPHDCLVYVDKKKISSLLYQVDDISIIVKFMRDNRNFNSDFSPNDYPTIQHFRNKLQNANDEKAVLIWESIKSRNDSVRNDLIKEWHELIQASRSVAREWTRERENIACFSERFDSSLMWAHYAKYHEGFVLEYDTTELVHDTICPFPVIYGNERYDATEYEIEFLKWSVGYFFYDSSSPFYATDQLHSIKSTTYKGADWKYEKEWRLLHSFAEDHPSKKYIVVKPKAIYLGSKMSESNKKIVLNLIAGKHMQVFAMYVDKGKRKYALNYKQVGQ